MELKRSFGISISEYAIVLTLVAVVAIPALMFLGNTIDLGFKESTTKHKAGVDNLNSLLSPERWDDSSAGISTLPGIRVNSIGEALPDSIEELNGLGLDGAFIFSNGSTTTSAAGSTQLISDLLNNIATTGQLFDGTVLTGSQQTAFQKLANKLSHIDSGNMTLDGLAGEQVQLLGDPTSQGTADDVINKTNDVISILQDSSDPDSVLAAFGGNINDPSYKQIATLVSLVTQGSRQISSLGTVSFTPIAGISSPPSLSIIDIQVPGFTSAASTAIATGTY